MKLKIIKRKLKISGWYFLLIVSIVGAFILQRAGLINALRTFLNYPSKTRFDALFVGLILLIISKFSTKMIEKIKHKPIVIPIPYIVFLSDFLSKKEIIKDFDVSGSCKWIRNGCIARGNRQESNFCLKYKKTKETITFAADFHAKSTRSRYGYWRYGLRIVYSNLDIAKFHIDSEDFIVLYLENKLIFRFKSEVTFTNRRNRLKICISPTPDFTNGMLISLYLNGFLISQKVSGYPTKTVTGAIDVWSDDRKDHNVKIDNIIIKSI